MFIWSILAFTKLLFAQQLELEKTLDKLNQYDIDEVEHIFKEHPHLRDFLYGKTHAMHPFFTFRLGLGIDFGVFKVPWAHFAKNHIIYPDAVNQGKFIYVESEEERKGFQFVPEEGYEPIELRKFGAYRLDTSISTMVFYFGPTTIFTWPKLLRGFQMVGSVGVWLLDGGDQGYTKGYFVDSENSKGWVITKRKSTLNSIGPYFGPGIGYVFSRLGVTRAEFSILWKGLLGFFPLFWEKTILDNEVFYVEGVKNIEDWSPQEGVTPSWVIREKVKRDLKESIGFLNELSLGLRFLVTKSTYVEIKGGVAWTILQTRSTKITSNREVLFAPHPNLSKFSAEKIDIDQFGKLNHGLSLFMGVSLQLHI